MSLHERGERSGDEANTPSVAPFWHEERAAEAEEILAGYADEAFEPLLRAAIVRHVLRVVCPEPEFTIRLGAMQAILRRKSYAEEDEARVVSRPEGRALGRWGVDEPDGEKHEVWVESLEPLRVSCGCRDFVKSSLGLCKHALVALGAIRPAAWGRAKIRAAKRPTLVWDPVQALDAGPDRLARLRVVGGEVKLAGFRAGAPLVERLETPRGRLALARALTRAIEDGVLDARPAARTVLGEELGTAQRLDAAERTRDATETALGTLRRRLYPYQREGVRRFLEKGRLLLGDDMGLGKTTQAAAAAHALFHTGQLTRGLLIVPASLKPQWRREWVASTDVPILVVDGPPEARARIYATCTRGVLVIGYEQLLRDLELVMRFDPELVILDEAQRIKNRETRSAIFVKALSPRFRLALTGTPMENRLSELGSIVDFIDDTALMPSWRLSPFHTFSEGDGDEGVSGARNLSQLRTRLAPVMLRRVRREVISQLPDRTDTRVPVPMTGAQRSEHGTREVSIAALLGIAGRRGLTQPEHQRLMKLFTQQRIICNGLAQLDFDAAWGRCEGRAPTTTLLDSLDSPKLAALRPLVHELCVTQRRKVVVFSSWRRMLRLAEWAVRDVLDEAGQRAAFFTGAESPKLRERALVDFHDDPSVSMLFLTDAGGVGLNLQRAATACIQLELPWNPAVMEQRIGRIHRLGQSRAIDVFHLVSEGGIESRIADVISHKRALFTGLFDGTSDEVRFDGRAGFVEQLRAVMRPVAAEEEPIAVEPIEAEPTAADATAADSTVPESSVPEGAALLPAVPATPVPAGSDPAEILHLPAREVAPAPVPATPPSGSPPASRAVPAPSPPHAPAPTSEATGPSAPTPEAPPPTSSAAPFQINRRADGSLSIEVGPAFAAPLAGLLASLAQAILAGAASHPEGATRPGESHVEPTAV